MRRCCSFLFGVALAASLAASLAAQTPTPAPAIDTLRNDLTSTKPVEVAWAAHHVRAGKHKELVVPLQRALGTWRRTNGEQASVVCLHVLDALIALEAKVPAGELVDLVDDEHCGTAAFVLLAREPKTNEAELFELFRRDLDAFRSNQVLGVHVLEPRAIRTAICGDVLARQSPGRLAPLAAPRCDWTLMLTVTERSEPGKTKGFAFVAKSRPEAEATPDSPPVPRYWLAQRDEVTDGKNAIVVVPDLAHVVLRDEGNGKIGRPARFAADPRPKLTHEQGWLVAAAGVADRPTVAVTIALADDAQYLREATAARDRLQACVDEMRTKLVANGALRAEDAPKLLPTKIDVVITDERKNATAALPPLPSPK